MLAYSHPRSLSRFTDIVPKPDDWFVATLMLKTEYPDAGGAAEEHSPGGRYQAVPACRNHPNDVAAGKRQDVAFDAKYFLDETVGSLGDVFG